MTADAFVTTQLRQRTIWDRIVSKVEWFYRKNIGKKLECIAMPPIGMEWVTEVVKPLIKHFLPRGSVLVIRYPVDRMGSILTLSCYRVAEPDKVYSYDINLIQAKVVIRKLVAGATFTLCDQLQNRMPV